MSPIIIIGMGRSGTTILHELLALDPLNRTPATWEVDMPFPAPEAATYDNDPRIEEIQSRLDRTDQIIPDFKKMHRMGATLLVVSGHGRAPLFLFALALLVSKPASLL